MKRLTGYFLQGLLYIAPITLTIYIIYWIFIFTDNLLQVLFEKFLHVHIPGLGVLIIIIGLTLLGYIGQTIIARPVKYILTRFVLRIPVLNLIYSSFKDFFSALVGKEKKFNKPVKVRINSKDGIFRLGFITNESLEALGVTDLVAVYFPFSYTFTGETFLVSREHIEPVDLPATEVIKFLMAGGVADIDRKKGHE